MENYNELQRVAAATLSAVVSLFNQTGGWWSPPGRPEFK